MANLVLFGQSYEVSEEHVVYNDYRSIFYGLAEDAGKDFVNFYWGNLPNDRLGLDQAVAYGNQLIQNALGFFVEKLTEKEIYEYSVDSIRRIAVQPLTNFSDAANVVYAGLDKIDATLQSAEAARQREINSASSSWTGGGHGLEGALKGAATAAMLNAASGAVTKAMTSGDSKKSKNKHQTDTKNLLQNTDTVERLCDGLYSDVFGLLQTYLKILVEDKSEQVTGITEAEIMKSNDIFNNLSSGVYKNPDIEKSMWIKMLSIYPYDIRYFILLLQKHDEAFDEILSLMNWYHIPVHKAADALLRDKYAFEAIAELETAQEQKQNLLVDLQRYGIQESGLLTNADRKIDEICTARKTYEDIVYETEELCEAAKDYDAALASQIEVAQDLDAMMQLYLAITTGSNYETYPAICEKRALELQTSLLPAIKKSENVEALQAYLAQLNTEQNAELNAPLVKQLNSKINGGNLTENLTAAKDKVSGAAKGLFGKAKGMFKK